MDEITSIMISKAHAVLKNAYAPYSHFSVAACIRTDKDNLYTGVNVENASYGLTVCAESSAISTMISAGEKTIKSVVVMAGTDELCPPCGSCRQKLHEFSNANTLIHLCGKDRIIQSKTIDELLPLAFIFKP